jgi:SAM-dependent methyltransferase
MSRRKGLEHVAGSAPLRNNPSVDAQTANFYELSGRDLAVRYEQVASPLAERFAVAFCPGARVLDVGSGSGRDLSALLSAGYDAYGVEPSSSLRAAAVEKHPELSGRIATGALPALGIPFGGAFDGVLCCAVLMHVPESQILSAATELISLISPAGRALISLPRTRPDLAANNRDPSGRLFQPYSPEYVVRLFGELGMELVARWDTEDALGRSGTAWFTVLFNRAERPNLLLRQRVVEEGNRSE